MVIKMNKVIRITGGIIRINGIKMYSPIYREHLEKGRLVARYPKRGEDHDEDEIKNSNRVSRTG